MELDTIFPHFAEHLLAARPSLLLSPARTSGKMRNRARQGIPSSYRAVKCEKGEAETGLSALILIMIIYMRIVTKAPLLSTTLKYLCAFTKTLNAAPPRGKLLIVPTPIGNMDDISPNMLRALLSADLIGCEDRRVAGQLYSLIRNRNILG